MRGAAGAPVVCAVDGSSPGAAAAKLAAQLARELAVPLVFVYVRRGPSGALGAPYHQRRLDSEMAAARRALDAASRVASRAGVTAEGEVLEGDPARRLAEFAEHRGARTVVLGSRRRRFGRRVARRLIRLAKRPVTIAPQAPAAAMAAA